MKKNFNLLFLYKGADIETNTLLQNIELSNSKAIAHGLHGNETDITCSADVIIVTMPVPQILNLKGLSYFFSSFCYNLTVWEA